MGKQKATVQFWTAIGATAGAFIGAVFGKRFARRAGYAGLCVISFAVCEYVFVVFSIFSIFANRTARYVDSRTSLNRLAIGAQAQFASRIELYR